MLRLLKIWIFLGWISVTLAQTFGDNFRLAYPELVHRGDSFEVSLITSNEFGRADKLDLYIIPQRGIKLESIILNTDFYSKEIEYSSASVEGYLYDAVMCSIDLSGSTEDQSKSFFQILLKFKSERIDYSEIEFYGEFRRNNKVINYLKNSNPEFLSDYPNHYRAKLNFYSSNSEGDKALLLKPNSGFSIVTDFNIDKIMLIDFWMLLKDKELTFLEIKNKLTGLVEYSLSTNDFQILTAESDFQIAHNINPCFIPTNCWLHISILFSFEKGAIEFFYNKKEFGEFNLPANLSSSDILVSFVNKTESSFLLDQFRIIEFNDSIDAVYRNEHYSNFISDNSEVKFQYNFNESFFSDIQTNNLVNFNNTELGPSDAPIFSRAPELNLQVMNNYYELDWSGGDYANAEDYIVEQAQGEKEFVEIQKINAEKIKDKVYSALCERKNESEVIYFRIKQINKNGSVVFSSQVKVGQGELEEFVIGQNYPNPFNPATQISLDVLVDSDFEIVVYNLEGQKISVLHDGFLSTGEYSFTFDGSNLPSGIYLIKVQSTNFSQTKKMILAK